MFKSVKHGYSPVELEHGILKWWEEHRSFDKLREQNRGKPPWSFLDGPITANNPMGVHHAWGRTLKDAYQRFNAMTGRELRYQNGFDCQGLWVEVEVEKELGLSCKADIERSGLETFINACKERVRKFSEIQTGQSVRLGYWMDWDNSYFTMSDENNYTIWSFLKKCHSRKLIYKGLDSMPWCPRCETGISEQERREGYKNVVDVSLYVKYPLLGKDREALLVWTTTPWTLAANVACAVNPDMVYLKVLQGGEILYAAKSREEILKEKGNYEVLGEIKGSELVGLEYRGAFDGLDTVKETFDGAGYVHRVVAWDEVSDVEGTGIVHIAPGCGKEDFDLGKELNLPVLMPVDESGHYYDGYGFLAGDYAHDVVEKVSDFLREDGSYYKKEQYRHDYPHCWRCKTALIFRAVDEWYINMSWRDEIMEVVKQINWIPAWGREQELNWLENMHDWMISKKRFWGLALPIFECECGWFDVVGSKEELKDRAVSGWEKFDGHSPHRPWVDNVKIECKKCGKPVSRIMDVGNPWLDAGIVPYSTVRYNTDREYWKKWMPADLVLECFPGQFRNWFYSLLAMSTMMENIPPFKTLLGHALVRDEKGEEMHKSAGNAIWFDEAVEKMGADVMRWIYCGQNPTQNLNFGYSVGENVKRRVFDTWWNCYTFFVNYAGIDGFDPSKELVPYSELPDIDRWILSKLQSLIKSGRENLTGYTLQFFMDEASQFIERLSNWYIRRNRRRFWRPRNESDQDKLAAYQTLYKVLTDLCRIFAPVVPFITEEMYQNLVRSHNKNAPESVHHCDYPEYDAAMVDDRLSTGMDLVADTVSRALALREKRQIRVRQPLSRLIIAGSDRENSVLKSFTECFTDELNVKDVKFCSDFNDLVSHTVKPNFKTIGKRLGAGMKQAAEALAVSEPEAVVSELEKSGSVLIKGEGGEWSFSREDLVIEQSVPEQIALDDREKPFIAINCEITPELFLEGLARDVVRRIQQRRKELDFEMQDHILVKWDTEDSKLASALGVHSSYISKETLADSFVRASGLSSADAEAVEIRGRALTIEILRA